MLGSRMISKGSLLTLFVNDPNNPGNQRYILLLALNDCNLSLEMADFFASSSSTVRSLPSEEAMERFYMHLVKKGIVEKPANEVINIGDFGTPSREIMNEFKYSVNPIETVVAVLRDTMVNKSRAFFNHQGYRIMILDYSGSLSEILFEILHGDLWLGSLPVGVVFDRTTDAVLNDDDLLQIKSIVEEMVCIKQQPTGISIGRIFVHLMPLVK